MPEFQIPESDCHRILRASSEALLALDWHILDVLEVSRPPDLLYAVHLSKVISKLSPLIGNMLEYHIVSMLNDRQWGAAGSWVRQDPGFPDTVFRGSVTPEPGIEIKTWFPFATEITARFKDSISHFADDQVNVAMLAWVPEHILFGRPRVLDVWVDAARNVASARDVHYHRPPDYLVFEPEDTSERTVNLQQTNTNGYKFQGSAAELAAAEQVVRGWGRDAKTFSPDPEYQSRLKSLLGQFTYRLDTNFAKMDRIALRSLEDFKQQVLGSEVKGRTIAEWSRILRRADTAAGKKEIAGLIVAP